MTSCKPAHGMDMCIDYKQWSPCKPATMCAQAKADCTLLQYLLHGQMKSFKNPGRPFYPPVCCCPAGTKRGRAPVWVDPADAAVSVPVAAVARLRKLRQYKDQTDLSGQQYEEALRRQHNILNPRTTWAAGKGAAGKASTAAAAAGAAGRDYVIDDEREPDESAAEQLLLSGSQLLLPGGAAAGSLLAAGSIEMSRLRDANGSSPCDAVVQALQFHPNGQLMLTAGFDKRLKLFQVGSV